LSALIYYSGTTKFTWLETKNFWYGIIILIAKLTTIYAYILTTAVDIRVIMTVMLLLALVFTGFGGILHIMRAQVSNDHTQTGRSLQFAPSVPEISVPRNNAVLQCIVDGDSTHGGSLSWIGPAVTSDRAAITLDTSRTVSTLTIASVGRSDELEGRYSCSTGYDTTSITLDVVCKFSIQGPFH
jgi:hypothetical protein